MTLDNWRMKHPHPYRPAEDRLSTFHAECQENEFLQVSSPVCVVPVVFESTGRMFRSGSSCACLPSVPYNAMDRELSARKVFHLIAPLSMNDSTRGKAVCEDLSWWNSFTLFHHALQPQDLDHAPRDCIQLSLRKAQSFHRQGTRQVMQQVRPVHQHTSTRVFCAYGRVPSSRCPCAQPPGSSDSSIHTWCISFSPNRDTWRDASVWPRLTESTWPYSKELFWCKAQDSPILDHVAQYCLISLKDRSAFSVLVSSILSFDFIAPVSTLRRHLSYRHSSMTLWMDLFTPSMSSPLLIRRPKANDPWLELQRLL